MCPFGLLAEVYPVNNVTQKSIGMNFLADKGGTSLEAGWLAGWLPLPSPCRMHFHPAGHLSFCLLHLIMVTPGHT